MRTPFALLLCFAVVQARAEAPPAPAPDPEKEAVIAQVLERFWSPSPDANGEPVRHTLPVPTAFAYRAIEAGEISGEGLRCNLRWIRHANSISASARKLGMTGTQVAFINALHDTKQAQAKSTMIFPCADIDESQARKNLDRSTKLGLEVSTIFASR
jgi:hypothetical protein